MPPHLVGAFSESKPADAETQALFSTPEALAAVAAKAGHAVTALTVESFATQVVAGLKYRVTATLTGEGGAASRVTITAFKPLPHTGGPLAIEEVVAA
jgi:hypothetical protein